MQPTDRSIPCPTCGAMSGKTCVSLRAGKPIHDMHRTRRLLSCRQAAAWGIERLRKPIWSNPLDHVKIDITDGALGPWLHLFAPFNQECNGRDPVDICWLINGDWVNVDAEELVVYNGPLPTSEEYRADALRYKGALA